MIARDSIVDAHSGPLGAVNVISGAASGIGRQLVGRLAGRGDRVLATDQNQEGLELAARTDGWPSQSVDLRRLDVRDAGAWDAAVDEAVGRWGAVDRLFNVAGIVQPAWVQQSDGETLLRQLDVNARGTILGSLAAAKAMAPRKSGHIVNVCSLAGLAPVPGIAAYCASKFAVRGFSLSLAAELKSIGIAVSCVYPDAVQTPMLDHEMKFAEALYVFSGPRLLTAAEVAGVIVDEVLVRRPLERAIPRRRGWLAKFVGAMPGFAEWMMPSLARRGMAQQAKYAARRGHCTT